MIRPPGTIAEVVRMANVEKFRISIPRERLADLQRRLEHARFPHDYANHDWSYGTPLEALRTLVDYWREDYDWRAQERAINAFDHYRVDVDGLPIHFVRAPGKGPAPLPLILSHGWPWTFWDLHRVIGPLSDPAAHGGDPADAFEVIVPSMPGFGFSTPLQRTGINFWTTADVWHRLMTEVLGFQRYAAQGGDWGALTTTQLGHKYAASLHGIHLSTVAPLSLFNHERPWDVTGGMLAPAGLEDAERAAFLAWQQRIAAHVAVQVLDPQTLSYAMHDSPVGLLAWLIERRRAWGDCRAGLEHAFDRDFLLTTAMLYWLTDSFVTSARFYAEAARNLWQPSHSRSPVVQAATGISYFTHDGTVGLGAGMESMFNLVFQRTHERGGHFAPAEAPEAIVGDLREMFRPLRSA
jgi:pimeloyl-ACP methyl ester carboxylesterase